MLGGIVIALRTDSFFMCFLLVPNRLLNSRVRVILFNRSRPRRQVHRARTFGYIGRRDAEASPRSKLFSFFQSSVIYFRAARREGIVRIWMFFIDKIVQVH
jgi:hypothetical protein